MSKGRGTNECWWRDSCDNLLFAVPNVSAKSITKLSPNLLSKSNSLLFESLGQPKSIEEIAYTKF